MKINQVYISCPIFSRQGVVNFPQASLGRSGHSAAVSAGSDSGWSSADVRPSERSLERSPWPPAGDPCGDLAVADRRMEQDGTWLWLKTGYSAQFFIYFYGNLGEIW